MNNNNYNNQQLGLMDIISLISFFINIANLNENLSQNDKQDLQKDLSNNINRVLNEVHAHLKQQDIKIDKILEVLSNDSR